jgi:hypothetical protein
LPAELSAADLFTSGGKPSPASEPEKTVSDAVREPTAPKNGSWLTKNRGWLR